MIETADKHGFTFDTVQMPVNALDEHYEQLLSERYPGGAKARHGGSGDEAAWAMAPFSRPIPMTAPEALHYAMSVPVTVTITGCQSMANLEQALRRGAETSSR